MESGPGDLWLLGLPVQFTCLIQRAPIDTESAGVMTLAYGYTLSHIAVGDGVLAILSPVTEKPTVISGIVKPLARDIQRNAPDLADQNTSQQ